MARSAALRTVRETTDQVFLSPRILDRTAFEEFAGGLRQLIEEATDRARTLDDASSRAAQAEARLPQKAGELEGRISAAAGALTGAEARAMEAQGMLTRAAQHLAEAQAVERRIEQMGADRATWLESRLAAAVARHEDRAREVDEKARAAADEIVSRTTEHLGKSLEAVKLLESRLAILALQIDTLEQRAQTLEDLAQRSGPAMDTMTRVVEARDDLRAAALESAGAVERCVATRDALVADVAILSQRLLSLENQLTGAVRAARETLAEARTVEVKPVPPLSPAAGHPRLAKRIQGEVGAPKRRRKAA
jgi:hypothetical protein